MRAKKTDLALLVLILLAAFALRVHYLTHDRFHADEALYAGWALRILDDDPLLLDEPVDKPPLYLYLLAASMRILGRSEVAARVPNLFASTLNVALLFRLARHLYGRRTARWAAFLGACSPFAILFARTAFTDPLLVTWMLVTLCALAARPATHAAALARYAGAGLAAGLAFATKQHAVLLLPLPLALICARPPCARPPHPRRRWVLLAALPGFALPYALVTWWDAQRWAIRPGFWQQSALSYGGLRWAPPAEWGERAIEWLGWARYLTGAPLLYALLALGALALLVRAIRRTCHCEGVALTPEAIPDCARRRKAVIRRRTPSARPPRPRAPRGDEEGDDAPRKPTFPPLRSGRRSPVLLGEGGSGRGPEPHSPTPVAASSPKTHSQPVSSCPRWGLLRRKERRLRKASRPQGVDAMTGAKGVIRRPWRPRARTDVALIACALAYLIAHILLAFSVWDRYLLPLVPLTSMILARAVVGVRAWARVRALHARPTRRWARHAALLLAAAVAVSALLSGVRAARNGYPVGGEHWAYQGLDQVVAYLEGHAAPDAVLYHHWLRWHYTYYLHGAAYELRWWESGAHLQREAARAPEREQYIVLPDWRDLEPDAPGLRFEPLLETHRDDGSTSLQLFRVRVEE